MDLFIVGSTVVDLIFPRTSRLPAWPNHTEFTRSNLVLLKPAPIVTLGGNGANAAFVAATAGVKVTLHTRIGDDPLGQIARAWLERVGCRLESDGAKSTALNVTAANPRLERATFFYAGEKISLPLDSHRPSRQNPRYVLVCGWPHPPLPELARFFAKAQSRGTFTALDAGPILDRPWSLRALRPVLAKTDLFLSNDHELQTITRRETLDAALTELRRVFAGHLVVKCGAKGARWWPAASTVAQSFPRQPVRVVNTVGAGDSFNGALLASLAKGRSFPEALRVAIKTAARVVSSPRGLLGVSATRKRP